MLRLKLAESAIFLNFRPDALFLLSQAYYTIKFKLHCNLTAIKKKNLEDKKLLQEIISRSYIMLP